MQTYIVHWQFPDQESHMQGAEAFAGFVEGGCEGDEFDGFKVLNRVVNPEGANGWAIVESSNHQNIWKWSSIWVDNFGVEIEVTPVLTDKEFLSVHKEIAAAAAISLWTERNSLSVRTGVTSISTPKLSTQILLHFQMF